MSGIPGKARIQGMNSLSVSQVRDRVWASTGYAPVRDHRGRLIISALRGHLRLKGTEALDIGCGSGILARALLDLGLSVTGVDPSEDSCAAAEKLCGGRGSFLRLRAEEAGKLGRQYDCVILSEVLEHLPDDRQALATAAALLKPGGILVITVPLHRSYWSEIDEADGHCRRYEPRELTALLGQAGLRTLETRKFHWLYYHTLHAYLRLTKRRFYSEAVFDGEASPSALVKAGVRGLFAFNSVFGRLGLGAHLLALAIK